MDTNSMIVGIVGIAAMVLVTVAFILFAMWQDRKY